MIKVLYVDHDMKRGIECTNLLSQEFNLEIAFTGWEGLGAAMLFQPDIMLLNLNVAVMDGVELLRLLRTEKNLVNLPVLGFTAPPDGQLEKQALEMTCTAIVEYPFDKKALSHLIEASLSNTK